MKKAPEGAFGMESSYADLRGVSTHNNYLTLNLKELRLRIIDQLRQTSTAFLD